MVLGITPSTKFVLFFNYNPSPRNGVKFNRKFLRKSYMKLFENMVGDLPSLIELEKFKKWPNS